MKDPKTLQEAIVYFANPDNCLEYMAAHRWPSGVVCPTCGRKDVTFLKTQRKWQCKSAHAKRQFTAKVGTIFEDSPLPLEKWLPAVWMVCNAKNGISSYELHRSLGVTQKTAWFMLHRIRTAMRNGSLLKIGGSEGGPVEVDETFVGGNPKNMHKSRRTAIARKRSEMLDTKVLTYPGKTVVFGMLDREKRQVRAQVVKNVKRETLQDAILREVETGSTVYTDAATAYYDLATRQYIHDTVNHVDEYVRGQIHTQGIENFWSLLKRTLSGTYVAVEPFHLDRYLDEQMFRYNNRSTKDNPLTDADRFSAVLMQIAGKRLTYADLTGKSEQTPF